MQAIEIADAIGARVRAGRARLGITRKQLAAKAEVSERYLHELENGAANASIGIIAKVADALGQSPLSLLSDDAARPRPPQPLLTSELTGLLQAMSKTEQRALAPVVAAWLDERRRASRGIALLGLRGAGKSTIGRLYARRHGLPLVSVTQAIELRAGMSLADLFNLGGPDAYRALENEVVAELVVGDGRIVLETAGGITANSEALDTILARFRTVWLKASPEEHLARVAGQGDIRPMQGNPKALEHLKALLAAREPEYARAEFVIDTTRRPVEACLAELEAIAAGVFQPA
jgi:XRE family aerobic/anaerobic benzoate catabolism transcriptional regulator